MKEQNAVLNQLSVFVSRSQNKGSIGLNRGRVLWDFSEETTYASLAGVASEMRYCSMANWSACLMRYDTNGLR